MSKFEQQPMHAFEHTEEVSQTKAAQKAQSKESQSIETTEQTNLTETNRQNIEYLGKQFALKQGFDAILTELRKVEREAAREQISQFISPEKLLQAKEKIAGLTAVIEQLRRDFEPDFENIEQSYQDYEKNSSREKFLNKINDNIIERTDPEYIEDVLKEQGPSPITNDLADIKNHLVTADAAQRILTISISKKEKDAKGRERVAERRIIEEGEDMIETEALKKNGWTIERIGELPEWEKQQKQAKEESLKAKQIIDQFKKANTLGDYEDLLNSISQEYKLFTAVGQESNASKKQELTNTIEHIQQETNRLKVELAIKEGLLGKNKAEQRTFRRQGKLEPAQEQIIQTKLKFLLDAKNTQNTKEKEIDLAEANIDYLQSLLEERKDIYQLEQTGALTEEELKTLHKEIASVIKELSEIIPPELQESAAQDAEELKRTIEQMIALSRGSLDQFSANALRWYKDGIGEFLARHPNLSPKLKSLLKFTEVAAAAGLAIGLGNIMIGCGGEKIEAKSEPDDFSHFVDQLSSFGSNDAHILQKATDLILQNRAEAITRLVVDRNFMRINYLLQDLGKSENPLIQELFETVEKIRGNFSSKDLFSYKQYLEIMIPEFVNDKITYSEFVAMAVDKQKCLKFITSQPDLVKYHPLIQESGRNIVKTLNALHERPDSQRFALVENASAEELYSVIVSGDLAGPHLHYPSTLKGLFKRFLSSIENGADFLEKVGDYQYRKFMLLGAFSNRADEFLATIEPAQREALVKNLIQGIEDGVKSGIDRDMQGIMIADILKDMSKNPENQGHVNSLIDTLASEYQQADNNKNLQFACGSSASILQNALNSENTWLKEMSQEYPVPDFSRLAVKELINEKGEYIEQAFFLKENDTDDDMETSSSNFMEGFQDRSKWKIEEKGSFYTITSKGAGNKIKIYANKFADKNPEIENKACADIANYMQANNEQPAGIIQRGHYWHITGQQIPGQEKTKGMMDYINDKKALYSNVKMVFLGGCFSFNSTDSVISVLGEKQIFSSKSTATKYVTDPSLQYIHNSIQQGKDIVWSNMYEQIQQDTKREEAQDIVTPDQNSLLKLCAIKQVRKNMEPVLVAAR